MSDTTLEEARRCPKCQELGAPSGTRPAPERYMGTLHIFSCINSRCSWYETTYTVQVRPDGTIPDPTMDRDKNFPKSEGVNVREQIAKARAGADASIGKSLER